MSFLADLPRWPLAPAGDSRSALVRELTPDRRDAWFACAAPSDLPLARHAVRGHRDRLLPHWIDASAGAEQSDGRGLHGGIITTMLDTAAGEAMVTTKDFAAGTVALDVKSFKLLLDGRAIAEARIQRKGRSIVLADAGLMSESGEPSAAGACITMPAPIATRRAARAGDDRRAFHSPGANT